MKVRRSLRLWLAVILLILSIALLVVASWPLERVHNELALPTVAVPQGTPSSFIPQMSGPDAPGSQVMPGVSLGRGGGN